MAGALKRGRFAGNEAPHYRIYLFPMMVAGVILLFLSAPWSFQHKAHVALHGLCAQRPSHSFFLGVDRLPFDARMTGIYGGFAMTAVFLAWRGRYRAAALPSRWTLGLLALFVGVMAIDGFNSTLVDLRLWHAYEPHNLLRLATGSLTGIALAAVMCYMVAVTLWHRPDLATSPVDGPRELGLLIVLQIPFAAAVASEAGLLYTPVSLLLVLSAAIVLTLLMLVVVVLIARREGTYSAARQIQGSASIALALALVMMAVLGGGRFLFEHLTGAPPMT
ncbi:MAG: DUF2085 domain-containing protein [Thermomicrobiales bacterium]